MKHLFSLLLLSFIFTQSIAQQPFPINNPGCIEFNSSLGGFSHVVSFTPGGSQGYPNPCLRAWYRFNGIWNGPVLPSYSNNGSYTFLIPGFIDVINNPCIDVVIYYGDCNNLYQPPTVDDPYETICLCPEDDRCNSNFKVNLNTITMGTWNNFNLFDVILGANTNITWLMNTPSGQPDRILVYEWTFSDPAAIGYTFYQYAHLSDPIPTPFTYQYSSIGSYNICLRVYLAQLMPGETWNDFLINSTTNGYPSFQIESECQTCLEICLNTPTGDGIELKPKGIFENHSYTLSPNPSSDFLTVNGNESLSKINSYEIFDFNGSIIRSSSYRNSAERINIKDLLPGVYILKLKGTKEVIHLKFIKE